MYIHSVAIQQFPPLPLKITPATTCTIKILINCKLVLYVFCVIVPGNPVIAACFYNFTRIILSITCTIISIGIT